MFGSNKKDPLVDAVAKVMQENQVRRNVEREVNETYGIHSKKALPFEKHAEYDRVLAEKTQKALNEGWSMKKEELVGNQHKIDANKNNKIDGQDFKILKAKKEAGAMEEELDADKKAIPPGKSSDPDFGAPGANPDSEPRIKFEPKKDEKVPLPPKRPANLKEAAPKGAKFERMIKHIKDKYSKDGLTKKEKSIAYATAWKAKNKEEKND